MQLSIESIDTSHSPANTSHSINLHLIHTSDIISSCYFSFSSNTLLNIVTSSSEQSLNLIAIETKDTAGS